jgi:hypothetical protein
VIAFDVLYTGAVPPSWPAEIPPNEERNPYAPHDPTRTRQAIERRIAAQFERIPGDDYTSDLCEECARMARRYFFGDELADQWLRAAERMRSLATYCELPP